MPSMSSNNAAIILTPAHGAAAQAPKRSAGLNSIRALRLPSAIRALLCFLVFPNAVVLATSSFFAVDRQVIDIDYAVAGIAALLLGPWFGMVALLGAFLADLLVTFAPLYNFGLYDAATSLGELRKLPAFFSVSLIAIIIGAGGAIGRQIVRLGAPSGIRRNAVLLACCTLMVVGLDFANGSNRWSPLATAEVPVNIATSAGFKLLDALLLNRSTGRRMDAGTALSKDSVAAASLWHLADRNALGTIPEQNVVLVLVESFGQLRDSVSQEMVLAPYRNTAVTQRYRVSTGSVPFEGATTSGELRELCALLSTYRAVKRVDGARCLPSLFERAQFSTVALHGYKKTFFSRSEWYPRLGFQRVLFEDSLRGPDSVSHCGYVYRGTCDTRAAWSVLRELETPPLSQRRFVYWLTLNSHLPLDEATARPSTFSCQSGVFSSDSEVCLLARIQNLVNTSVVRVALDPRLKPTRFIIVGDHTPPFALGKRRDLFVKGRVPYIELRPRSGQKGRW
jgi:hypothetical protein